MAATARSASGSAEARRSSTCWREMVNVAEGVPTTRSVHSLAARHGVEMPITAELYQVLFEGKPPRDGRGRPDGSTPQGGIGMVTPPPESCAVAFKEWAGVCDALIEGRQTIIIRKGGISEGAGPGVFVPEHAEFWLYPTWVHQAEQGLRSTVGNRHARASLGSRPDRSRSVLWSASA